MIYLNEEKGGAARNNFLKTIKLARREVENNWKNNSRPASKL